MIGLRFGLMTLLLAVLALTGLPVAAQTPGAGPHIRMELIPETSRPAPGQEVTLAFASVPEEGWHGYWQNPGDAGIPTAASWTLPDGVTAGDLRFPVPERLMIAGIMNYVYEGPYALLATLRVPENAAPGMRLPVAVKLDYLVCTLEFCVPESAELATELTVGDGAVPGDRRARFDEWRAALPRPLGAQGSYQVNGDAFRLEIPYPADAEAEDPYFFPITDGAIDYSAPQMVARDGDRLVIETGARGAPGAIEGVLAIDEHRGFVLTAGPGNVAPAPAGAAAGGERPFAWQTALLAFLGAVLGGLILNIMPCVFPILSLKALSLAKANAGEGNPRREALAYAAGVILVCLVLGGVLLGLRAAGASAGWGFQLMDPRVILLLLLLVVAIALNLAGLFEVAAPGFVNRAATHGTGSSFATGALAAFVATPCTGPFMGAALGAALVLPWAAALAVFGGLGLGIALPFLLLGFVPALRRRLPKPGPWMGTLRRILSIPMFLTALALAWVLGRQAGVDGMTLGLSAALLAALALWWVGRRQQRGARRQWAPALPLLLLSLAAVAVVRPAPVEAEQALASGAEPFSEERLEELQREGRPVFAYFTADWCLTCKVNEKTVIETQGVRDALAAADVAVLVGDWTDGDPVLGRFIERHNRAGVPLYLWYAPGADEAHVLPQLLTQAMLRDLAARDAAS
ncbi:protein-disulfide reductase DsbD family protein [Sphingosinithalassobacter sp. CS137]|uniref:protein-disulfide reductase DsbD family protein n=1 Tax=Sphingosinithalassobacter sp. CS137 TaxID=2762748 RepID=UPI00165E0A1C|nr:protein-disulfide reductase DsbD domain-containing protein [Sphingosinithalassobacter sp. CS137]